MRIFRFFCLICALAVILSFSAFASPPVIIAQPQDYYFPPNTTLPAEAHFSILAEGENLTYQWQYYNGEWLNGSTNAGALTPNYSAILSSWHINQHIPFRCIVSSDDGSVISQTVSVTVYGYVSDTISQMLSFIDHGASFVLDTAKSVCNCIVSEPLLLFTVGFLAVGGCIALVSRLLARS